MPPSSTVSLNCFSAHMCTSSTPASLEIPCHPSAAAGLRRGKAPPVDNFTGEDCAVRWEDWLPTWSVRKPGMDGQMRRVSCSWLVVCEAGH